MSNRLFPSQSSFHFFGAAKIGVGFGTALAITISWSANKSLIWAIIHGLLSWLYVIYYVLRFHGQ